jgi:hypothetical protein
LFIRMQEPIYDTSSLVNITSTARVSQSPAHRFAPWKH